VNSLPSPVLSIQPVVHPTQGLPTNRSVSSFSYISFIFNPLRTLQRSCSFFSQLPALFSMACRLFSQNTRGWGVSTAPDVQAFRPSKRANSFLYKSLQPLLHRKKVNSFAINKMQPLFAKHTGGGDPDLLYLVTSLRHHFFLLDRAMANYPPSRASTFARYRHEAGGLA
jgi:hypothetical protein